jgi:uncharacterized protein with NRDE domain
VCTLIVAWRVFDAAPVCVAANRDELYDRPASPPTRWDTTPAVVAPRDERARGTWIGYNAAGVFVAITNRWVPGEGDRSRGLLVADALEAPSATAAVDLVEAELGERRYAPFHLVAADAGTCTLVRNGGTDDRVDGHRTTRLEPGVHVVVNVGVDGDWFVPSARPDAGRSQADNAERVRRALRPGPEDDAAVWLDRAGAVLGAHEYGVCLHGDGFGTRSSSLLALGNESTFRFADGPPCETPYERVEDRI